MKPSIKYILPLVLVSSSALVYSIIKNQANPSPTNNNSDNSSYNSNQDKQGTTINLQKLSVLSNRCRGCGKCVRIDPEHFEMSGRVAVVTSSTNLNSSNLTLAINNCPAQAIVLE